jgi:Na+:H+ antiporter, NhaA family
MAATESHWRIFGIALNRDAAAGLVLIGVTIAALLCANTPLAPLYDSLFAMPLEIRLGPLSLGKPLLLWINDGLMAVFFFLVGLEIKSEFMEGTLSSRDKALLPVIAAAGGMAAPALVYIAAASGDPAALRGWAIPAATDIAFAVGVLGLIGSRAPAALKAFLLALAVLDDLGSVIIIATFYTDELSTLSLTLAALLIAALAIMNRLGVMRASAYVLVGIVLWLCVLKSGVHATLAGVFTALFVPLHGKDGEDGPLHSLFADLQWPVSFAIVPMFAFANAGVPLTGLSIGKLTTSVTAGVALGLIVGKPVGVIGAVWLATVTKLARLPDGISWRHVAGAGFLAGIGFTMSLFIGTLAFDDAARLDQVRLGVLAGSLVSAVLGAAVLWGSRNSSPSP